MMTEVTNTRTVKGSGVFAPSVTRADQAVEQFHRDHGVLLELTDGQKATVNDLLRRGQPARATAYLGLCSAGVGLVPRNTTESRERVDALLDAALQVWAGKNRGAEVRGSTPLERLTSYAQVIRAEFQSGGALDQNDIPALRGKVLRDRSIQWDAFERTTGLPALRLTRVPTDSPLTLPEENLPPATSYEAIMGNSQPQLKVTPERAAGTNLTVDTIPGTDKPWSVKGVVDELLDTEKDKKILDLLHGLHPTDRQAVADEVARREGWNVTGQAAIDKLHDHLKGRVFGILGVQGKPEEIFLKAYLYNPSGQAEAADVLAADLEGWTENAAAITRTMMGCKNAEQLDRLEEMLKKKYDKDFGDIDNELKHKALLIKGESLDSRRFEFVIDAIRKSGEVTDAHLRAFELREAVRNPNLYEVGEIFRRGGTDENRIFRLLETLTPEEYFDVAAAYKQLNDNLWKDKVQGDGGESGEVRATALFYRLHDDLDDDGQAMLQRLVLASNSLKWDPATMPPHVMGRRLAELSEKLGKTATVADLEYAHGQHVAQYVAITLRLAGSNALDADDVMSALKLIADDPDPQTATPEVRAAAADGVINGQPTMQTVFDSYRFLYGNQNLARDLQIALDRPVETIAEKMFVEGQGWNSPEVAALRLEYDPDDLAAIDLSNRDDLKTTAERLAFVAKVKAEFKANTGKDLVEFLAKEHGREFELSDGRKIPSRAMILAEHGQLTPAERLVYAMHQRGRLGLFSKADEQAIIQTMAGLSPLEKLIAMNEYARIVHPGATFDPANGQNPLASDLRKLRGRNIRQVDMIAQVLPQDVDRLTLEVAIYLQDHANPVVDEWIRKNVGDPAEFMNKNFGDADPRPDACARTGIEGLANMFKAFEEKHGPGSGPREFARAAGLKEDLMLRQIAQHVDSTNGSGLQQMLTGIGVYTAGVENAARHVGAAVVDAMHTREQYGEITEAQVARMQTAYTDLVKRLGETEQLRGKRVELISNIALAVAIGGVMVASHGAATPGLLSKAASSPVWMGLIGGAAKGGTYLLLDGRDKVDVLVAFAKGMASGAAAPIIAGQTLPPEVVKYLGEINPALAASIRGGIGGVEIGAWRGLSDALIDGVPIKEWIPRTIKGGVVGGAVGFVAGGMIYYGKKGWDKLFGDKPKSVKPVDDPVDDPIDDPVDPDRPPGTQPGTNPQPGDRAPGTMPQGPGGVGVNDPAVNPTGGGGVGTRGPGTTGGGTTGGTVTDPTGTGGLGGRDPGGTTGVVDTTTPISDLGNAGGLGGRDPGGVLPGGTSGGLVDGNPVVDAGGADVISDMDITELTGVADGIPVVDAGGADVISDMDLTELFPGATPQATFAALLEGQVIAGSLGAPMVYQQGMVAQAGRQLREAYSTSPGAPRTAATDLYRAAKETGMPGVPAKEPKSEREIAQFLVTLDKAYRTGDIEQQVTEEAAAAERAGKTEETAPVATTSSNPLVVAFTERLEGVTMSLNHELSNVERLRSSGVAHSYNMPVTERDPATGQVQVRNLSEAEILALPYPPAPALDPSLWPSEAHAGLEQALAYRNDMAERHARAVIDRDVASAGNIITWIGTLDNLLLEYQERFAGRELDIADGTVTEPAQKDPPAPTTAREADRALDTVDLAVLQSHPRLGDADPKWMETSLKPGLEMVLGLEAGALAGASTDELVAKFEASYGKEGQPLRGMLAEMQRDVLVYFGLPNDDAQLTGAVNAETRAAYDNMATLFGPVDGDAMRLIDARSDLAAAMRSMAEDLQEDLPHGTKTAAEIRALGGANGPYQNLIRRYQGQNGLATTGLVDGTTFAHLLARVNEKAEARRAAEAERTGDARVTLATENLDRLIKSGRLDPETVQGIMAELNVLHQAQAAFPKARAGYRSATTRVIRELLGTDVKRAAAFAKHGANAGMEPILHDVLHTGIVERLDEKRKKEFGRELLAQNVNLSLMPVATLDALDNLYPTAMGFVPTLGGATVALVHDWWTADDRAVGLALHQATLERKEVHKVLEEDVHFMLNTLLSQEGRASATGKRLLNDIVTKVKAEDPVIKNLAAALGSRYGSGISSVTDLLKEIAGREGQSAPLTSALVAEMYAGGHINWEARDNFASDLCAPRSGSESWDRQMLLKLTPAARKPMAENLLKGGLFNVGVSGDEKALAAELERLGI